MTEHNAVIGVDIGDKYSYLNVIDNQSGEELERTRIATNPSAFRYRFKKHDPSLVVVEVSCHSGWISRLLVQLGHSVLVADPRKARKLMGREVKDDEVDAELLARIGRLDPKLLKPVTLRSEQTQSALSVVRSRDALVRARTQLVNHVRGTVKTLGHKLPSCSTRCFHRLVAELPLEFQPALEPVMGVIESITEQIDELERVIEQMCQQDYPQAQRLQQIPGVGPITALTYVLTIEDPARFRNSRQVGPYLGLVRRRWMSGDADPELHITKAGDAMLRRLLVNCAHHILGHFGQDCDLRRWGLKYADTGGKLAKKRAVIAVARRLAVLMHRLWASGKDYEPLYNAQRQAGAQ